MLELEFTPILIDAHRDYLRSLGAAPHESTHEMPAAPARSRRRAVGQRIVRLGHWLENRCPEVVTKPQVAIADSPGCA